MQAIVLTVILVAAALVFARIIWKSVRNTRTGTGRACRGCPFESKCDMGDRPRVQERADGGENAD